MKLSVIIPVYNEEVSIKDVVKRVQALKIDKEIIIVDDGSNDRSRAIISRLEGVKKIFHEKNMGKGRAIRTGLEVAQGDFVIIQDADLEYNPEDYYKLLEPLKNGKTNVVYGSRFKGKGKFLKKSYHANKFLTFLTNLLFGGRLSDMETCYKVVKSDLIKSLNLQANRFEIEPEITVKLLKRHEKIFEVPIFYQGRRTGKKIGFKDGVAAILNLIKWKITE